MFGPQRLLNDGEGTAEYRLPSPILPLCRQHPPQVFHARTPVRMYCPHRLLPMEGRARGVPGLRSRITPISGEADSQVFHGYSIFTTHGQPLPICVRRLAVSALFV